MLTLTVHLQAHVATASRIGDHCRTYALSCPVDSFFESSCDHEHDLHCERCDLFPSVLQEILAVLREKPQSEELEELSTKSIKQFKISKRGKRIFCVASTKIWQGLTC